MNLISSVISVTHFNENGSDLKCCFNYPFDLSDKRRLEFEKIHNKDNQFNTELNLLQKGTILNEITINFRAGELILTFRLSLIIMLV